MRASAGLSIASARVVAWTGATLFVVSLTYFLFSYAITFGAVTVGGGFAWPVTGNVALFTIFAMHHSVFARDQVRSWVTSVCPGQLERSFYVWVASLLFIAVCALWQPIPGVAWQPSGAGLWVLRMLQAIGVWLTLRSAAILDVFELSGIRQAESPVHEGRHPAGIDFKTRGPYGWVRHPIYTGWFLMVLTASPMTMTRLVFAVVSCAYLVAAIPFEERSLLTASSGGYQRYMTQVRWKLVPGVY